MSTLRKKFECLKAERTAYLDSALAKKVAENQSADVMQSELDWHEELLESIEKLNKEMRKLKKRCVPVCSPDGVSTVNIPKYPVPESVQTAIQTMQNATLVSTKAPTTVALPVARTYSDKDFATCMAQYKSMFCDPVVRSQMFDGLLAQNERGEIRFTPGQLAQIDAAT